jgi:hypothetical protein
MLQNEEVRVHFTPSKEWDIRDLCASVVINKIEKSKK